MGKHSGYFNGLEPSYAECNGDDCFRKGLCPKHYPEKYAFYEARHRQFNGFAPQLLETYRGYEITTRIGGKGTRIYRVHFNGRECIDFARSVDDAKARIDNY